MAEADGKKLRRDLGKELRKAAEPIVLDARANILGMASSSRGQRVPLRATIAREVKVQTRWTGKTTGVRIRVGKRKMPRDFRNAPKRLNSGRGWRHPVFGDVDTWVQQNGRPSWFHDATRANRPEVKRAVLRAMNAAVQRIGGAGK